MADETIYAILDVTIKEREKFLEYIKGHRAFFQEYGGRLLFRSNDMESN